MEIDNKANRNSFNVMRLCFAIFVLITHSFSLTGNESKEPLSILTNGQINFSYIGLRGFFTISGFLILQSFERSTSALDFLLKRILRIFPALLIICIIMIFIICPIISSSSVIDYLSDKKIYLTFLEFIDPLFLLNKHYSVLGVFKNNPSTDQLNGSLWTISYEFLFYLSFLVLFIKKNKIVVAIAFSILLIGLFFIKIRYLDPWYKYDILLFNTKFYTKATVDFLIFFTMGVICAIVKLYKLNQKFLKQSLLILSILITGLLAFNVFHNFYLFFLAPLFILMGLINIGKWDITRNFGDISYGIYLASFFIQQLLMSIYSFGPYTLLFFSLSLSITYGLFSWNYIEKPFMLYKGVFKKVNFGRK